MVLKEKLEKKERKDFSTEKQIEKIIESVPNIKCQGQEATEI